MVSEYIKLVLDSRVRPVGGYNNHMKKVGTWPENDTYFLRKATRFLNIAEGYEAYKNDIKTIKKPEGKKYCLIRLDIF